MNKRIIFIFTFLIIVFSFVTIARIINLTFANKDYYAEQLEIKTNRIISGTSAPRGKIMDRNGNILADNIGIKTIIYTKISGIKVSDELEIATRIAAILDINDNVSDANLRIFWLKNNEDEAKKLITEEEYDLLEKRKLTNETIEKMKLERITQKELDKYDDFEKKCAQVYYLMNKGYGYEKKLIKDTDVTEEEYAKIMESKIIGVTGEISWERTYPYGNIFRTILGSISSREAGIPVEEKDKYLSLGYSLTDRVGISYLEKQYEEYLRGTKDLYQINNDNTLSLYKEGNRGNDLVLSIDIDLQIKIEEILAEEITSGKKLKNTEHFNSSYVIISEPKTGAILAMSGKELLIGTTNSSFKDVTTNIITSSFTMGSIVKGASMTVGYQNNLITNGKKITDSCVKLYLNPEKCSWKRLGVIDEISALKHSSNYYQFMLAIGVTGNKYRNNMKLNPSVDDFLKYRNTFASYGLGVPTGIDLPNEKVGLIGDKITGDMLLNLAIGQYDTYTPIEIVQYINTIANDGTKLAPSLMLAIFDNEGNIIKSRDDTALGTVDIESDDLKQIQKGFIEVVKRGGTASGFTNLAYKPAGKTGTSESFLDSDNNGIIDVETTTATYAMYAPYDNPKYSMVVISPHVSHKNGNSDYLAWINRYISKKVSDFLFENY